MTLETEFHHLSRLLMRLGEALGALHTTVVEDRPQRGESVLVDLFGDGSADLAGRLQDALSALQPGLPTPGSKADLERARTALADANARFLTLYRRLANDWMSYERLSALAGFGRREGGEWAAWARSVRAALDRCQAEAHALLDAFRLAWVELAERLAAGGVSVQATNIGQQITVPEGRALPQGDLFPGNSFQGDSFP